MVFPGPHPVKQTPLPRPTRVISGGQTGVDRAALDAALTLGIACGGWCPRGRLAEDGPISPRYPLQETESSDYAERTERNVAEASATLILASGGLSGGTALTRDFASRLGKPVLVVDLNRDFGVNAELTTWLQQHGETTLNVAGPRESSSPGIYRKTLALLLEMWG